MFDKQSLLKNCEPDEKLLIAKALDQAYLCLREGTAAFTDFSDPIKMEKCVAVILKAGLCGQAFGGYDGAERVITGIAEDEAPDISDFPISILKVEYGKGGSKPTHRDFLGSILGLGLDRGKIGDIRLESNCAYVYVKAEIADYIMANLERVGRLKVSVGACEINKVDVLDAGHGFTRLTVASLRADAVLAAAFHLSRGTAQSLIDADKMQVNWSIVSGASRILKEGDLITLRGYGRVKINEISGPTKKNRVALLLEVF